MKIVKIYENFNKIYIYIFFNIKIYIYSLILKFLIIFKKYYKICNKNYLLFNFVKYKYKKTICTNI